VLLDISMKQTGGVEALQQLKRIRPRQGADFVDAHRSGTDHAGAGIRAHGYLLKDTTATELEQALEALRNNERYLSPAIAHTVINQALTRTQKNQPEVADSHNLTPVSWKSFV
jgi:DNA-binding NarL/FixJ family response regulator